MTDSDIVPANLDTLDRIASFVARRTAAAAV
jgi:hypothetical protein